VSGGDLDPRHLDVEGVVVVPARPGPVVRLADLDGRRDEIDEVLDDVFGAPDAAGAGPLDAVLLLAGAAAVIAGLASIAPMWVLVVGAVAFALGAILPLRTFWRRAADGRRVARLRSMIGDGVVLRTDHPAVSALIASHDRCIGAAAGLPAWRRVQVDSVAHAALTEVATLLAGRSPAVEAEVRYATERTRALDALSAALVQAIGRDPVPDADERRALVDARGEVEQIAGGSAVLDAETLARSLRGPA
jgi:hypothetical protein